MIGHVLTLAKRICREIYRDELFVFNSILGPVLTLYIVKVVADSLCNIPFLKDFIPLGAMSIGFVALIIHFNGYVLCTLVIIRERISGTLERVFMATFRRHEIMLGYLLGYSTVILGQTVITLLVTRFFFGVRFGPNLPGIFLFIFLLGIVSIGMALFVSNFARREAHAMVAIPLILLPAFLLSGLIFPMEALQKSLRAVSYLFPLRYCVIPLQQIILSDIPAWKFHNDFLLLLLYGAIMIILGTLTLRDRE
jgi:ABC-2 type transport system permease protein